MHGMSEWPMKMMTNHDMTTMQSWQCLRLRDWISNMSYNPCPVDGAKAHEEILFKEIRVYDDLQDIESIYEEIRSYYASVPS
jgi:hypothetical protein